MSDSTSLPIADVQKRISAFVIDDIVISLFFLIILNDKITLLMSSIQTVDQSAVDAINLFISENILVVFAIRVLYHTVLVWQNGMTFGKYVTKIRVIDLQTGSTPTFTKAFFRASIRLVSEALLYLGFFIAFFVPRTQTLHDKFSHCVVVDA